MLLGVLLVTACGQPATPPATPPATKAATVSSDGTVAADGSFTGDWTTIGTRQVLDLGPGQQAVIFQLSGSLLLNGKQRINRGFQAQVIGFSDTTTGLQGRSVWTDEHGDKVFSELSGEGLGPGLLIEGKLTGGSGRYAGISGEYSFKWKRIGAIEGSELTGRVVDLSGWARLGSPSALAPTTAGGQQ
ncbi:hypothetical protein [Candidatus Accumulibacter sp. ACC003]|uniref:hypothetical protein n=1 Tax=Candidatus Accumulibacter sp. ACC003 TaxID=2823334 RepID=UPI0025BC84D0|nr:hypothetical protein [Candidatus Accumulibacter sp. ACC003]